MTKDALRPPADADPWRVTLDEARATPVPEGARSALLMRHGSMSLLYYAPEGRDRQQPHGQDEVYVVASGTGMFVNGESRVPFGPGDVLFYGPEGGEKPTDPTH